MGRRVETFLIIGLGGFAGANLRYVVSVWAVEQLGTRFPYGTLIVNFAGSILLAAFIAWAARHVDLDPRVRLLVAVGFFGAFTTFSTFATESVGLALDGNLIAAAANVLVTNAVCLAGVGIGLAVGRAV